jgi:hypothetical protein
VLSKIDLPPKDVLANVRELTGEVRALGNTLRETKAGENRVLESEIAHMKERLSAFSVSVDRLGNARAILTDEVAARFGDTVAQTLIKLKGCSFSAGPMGRRPQS